MSKCLKELSTWRNVHVPGSSKLVERIWKAAWNARGERCMELCNVHVYGDDMTTVMEAIKQEQCE